MNGLFTFLLLFVSIFLPHAVHAEDYNNPDLSDTTAVFGCWQDYDDSNNPIQVCGYGHNDQSCSYSDGQPTDCQTVFDPLPTPNSVAFAPITSQLSQYQPLTLAASWNSRQLLGDATTSIPINTSGTVLWNYSQIDPFPFPTPGTVRAGTLTDVLSSATLTIDVYKGVIGSSTIVYSKSLANPSPAEALSTSSSMTSFPFTFTSPGTYILAFSATYPEGTYAPNKSPTDICKGGGDFCSVPSYSLTDFQNMMTHGYDLIGKSQQALGNYTPAAYGIIKVTVSPSLAPAPTATSNVLFIPGTLSSRLYMRNANGSERDLWEPRSDLDITPLAMNGDGKSMNAIYTRDIVDHLYSNNSIYNFAVQKALGSNVDVYGQFEKFMDGLVTNGTIKEWRSYPYDWRYDVSDIVANGTIVGNATGTPSQVYLQDTVRELASSSPSGKVTIVAHSNGGLVAKALAIDLQKKGQIGLLDKIIMIGTPQFGTPQSVMDFLHGAEFTQLAGLLIYSNDVRNTEETMPGAYDLLPSPEYFSSIGTPVATFDLLKPALYYEQFIGAAVDSFLKLSDFLADTFHLDANAGIPGSSKTPIPLSSALIAKAKNTHAILDSWIPPAGLSVVAIAGWGQLTPYQTNYTGIDGFNCDRSSFFVPIACSLQPQLEPKFINTLNGDNTVVSGSALGIIPNGLFFNAKKYSADTKQNAVHQTLLATSPIQNTIKNILLDVTSSDPYISKIIPSATSSPMILISAHSPVNLVAGDVQGNQTGIIPVPELHGIYFEKEDIPRSSLQVVADEKYLYLPSDFEYSISMKGYDIGTTTIDIEGISSDGTATLVREFKDIPTTASTTAEFFIAADGTVSSTLPTDVERPIPPAAFDGTATLSSTKGSTLVSLIKKTSEDIVDSWVYISKNIPTLSVMFHRNLQSHFYAQNDSNIISFEVK
jgi:pimeloyl-ACP methyl ester carboxylesterase